MKEREKERERKKRAPLRSELLSRAEYSAEIYFI